MPRVNLDDYALADPRFLRLARVANLADRHHARGLLHPLWNECTQRQSYFLTAEDIGDLLPEVKDVDGFVEALVKVNLAERQEDGSFYIKGTRDRIEWYGKVKEKASKGGKATAATMTPEQLSERARLAAEARWNSDAKQNAKQDANPGKHDAEQDAYPLALAPVLAPVLALAPVPVQEKEETKPRGSASRKRSASPSPSPFPFGLTDGDEDDEDDYGDDVELDPRDAARMLQEIARELDISESDLEWARGLQPGVDDDFLLWQTRAIADHRAERAEPPPTAEDWRCWIRDACFRNGCLDSHLNDDEGALYFGATSRAKKKKLEGAPCDVTAV